MQSLTGYQGEIFNKYKKSREIIIDYSNKEFEKLKEKEEEKLKIKRKGTKKEIENKIEENQNINNDINTLTQINSLEYKFKSNEFFYLYLQNLLQFCRHIYFEIYYFD